MAIYSCCPKCKQYQHVSHKRCAKCNEVLGGKYQVRVRDTNTGKWRIKLVHSLVLARKVEAKLKVQMLEEELFGKRKVNDFNIERYLVYAKQHKKSWK